MSAPLTDELIARLREYLKLGGLWNPELMDGTKTQQLIIDSLHALEAAEALAAASRQGPFVEQECGCRTCEIHVSDYEALAEHTLALEKQLDELRAPAAPPPWQPIELIAFLEGEAAEARRHVAMREDSAKTWRGGTNETWRQAADLHEDTRGQTISKKARMKHAEVDDRIGVKYRRRAEQFDQVIAFLRLPLPSPPASAPQPTEREKHDEDSFSRVDNQ